MDHGSHSRQAHHRPATPQTTSPMDSSNESSHGTSHERNKSGGIFRSFGFLRSANDAVLQPGGRHDTEDAGLDGSSIATALRPTHGRQRKGSLRKAAMARVRERSGSLLRKDRNPIRLPSIATAMSVGEGADNTVAPRFTYNHTLLPSPGSSNSQLSAEQSANDTPFPAPPRSTPPLPSSHALYASTTEEDEAKSFYRTSASTSASSFNTPLQGSTAFVARRRSHRSERRASVPVVAAPIHIDLEDEWDYSETEWWGWVVLVVTWVVFVVVMGSCLGVWSWAWDVGETPYAPPELEDDATLPITGYYPALMICTAIMAWVWVVVAWVGMKYFRHANVSVDG